MLNKTTCRSALAEALSSLHGVARALITNSSDLYKPETPAGKKPAHFGLDDSDDIREEIYEQVCSTLFRSINPLQNISFESQYGHDWFTTVRGLADDIILPSCRDLIKEHIRDFSAEFAGAVASTVTPRTELRLVGDRNRIGWTSKVDKKVAKDLGPDFALNNAQLSKLENLSKVETYGDAIAVLLPNFERAVR